MGWLRRTVTEPGCVRAWLSAGTLCFTNTELSGAATGHCCGLHPAWQKVSLPTTSAPIPAQLRDLGTLEGWGQSQPQYLEPEPQSALPGASYTGKGQQGRVRVRHLAPPYPAQPPVHYQAGWFLRGGILSRDKVSIIPTHIPRTVTTTDLPGH